MAEQSHLSPDDKRFDRPFRPVIVDRQATVLQIAEQFGPLVAQVG
ncbi:protein of unknown function [Xenorhabdus doucetiae]|uniref:Uncharacterized protein n=1 Tax=Xenorhabdus doucetiae TaxID=351671 RepID=A0A068QRE8_9GAMM|nr:protein of unknown function [Xenorhabdus doucetiae]